MEERVLSIKRKKKKRRYVTTDKTDRARMPKKMTKTQAHKQKVRPTGVTRL